MAKSKWSTEVWPISRPIPYPKNARIIPQEAIQKVAASIKEFGWRQPIVVGEDDVIIAGHTRLLAAQSLGLTEVPVHIAVGLSKDLADAYRLMDNRSNQATMWDNDLVIEELMSLKAEGYDLGLSGFGANEISTLLAPLSEADAAAEVAEQAKAQKPSKPEGDHSKEKAAPKTTQIVCPRCGKHFVEA